jgi:hypothetical protein
MVAHHKQRNRLTGIFYLDTNLLLGIILIITNIKTNFGGIQ